MHFNKQFVDFVQEFPLVLNMLKIELHINKIVEINFTYLNVESMWGCHWVFCPISGANCVHFKQVCGSVNDSHTKSLDHLLSNIVKATIVSVLTFCACLNCGPLSLKVSVEKR